MDTENLVTLGEHGARLTNIETDLHEVKGDVRWIRENLAEKKGERRVALWVASLGGAGMASLFTLMLRKLHLMP